MSQDNLYTESEGLRSFAQTHSDVAAEMSRVIDPASYTVSVALSHGAIASGMHNALNGAIDARSGARTSLSEAGRALADSLRQAAHAYDGVDDGAASQLRSAADAVDGTAAPARGGTSGPGGSSMTDLAGAFTGAGKDAAGTLGGVIGPMTSGLGSGASSLGSGFSSAAGAAANSIAQAVGQAAKAGAVPAGAVSAAASTDDVPGTTLSGGDGEARTGDGAAPGKAPGEHVILARSTSGPGMGGAVV
ncbi:type VII secretion target [Mycobacterium sp.]|uniref:type VII secretion target n=1 Tax=Mycobacterium sp. TaxID=1785 RepID=UPI0031D4BBEA